MTDLEALTAADFEPLLHDRFRIASPDAPPFEAELVEVTVIPREPGGREPFSLEFQGDPEFTLRQGIYGVDHERLGALEIFLVPIAPGRYEAVFT